MHPRAVEGRRHDKKAQILAERALRVERERKAEIGVERTLVELVEQHGQDAVERRIVEDHTGEHALGDNLDPRARRDETLQPDAQAHRLPDLLAQRRGHARRRRARGEAAGLEHDQAAAPGPRFIEQGERNARRLAGAGRGNQNRARVLRQRRPKVGQRLVDRKTEARIESHKSDQGSPNNAGAAPQVGEGSRFVKSASKRRSVEWTSN